MSIDALTADVREDLDAFLKKQLAGHSINDTLTRAMEHGVLLGGKRVRPYLLMTIADICGGDQQAALTAAGAIELVHAYSLIHDDLPAMDNDELRRGQPTCHIAFDEATAILAGDALQTLAFELLSESPLGGLKAERQLSMVNALARASGSNGMCAGQAIDLQATGQHVNENQLEHMHKHKTGALIKAAATMGVLCGEADALKWQPQFEEFAAYLGLAFQVQDDILDVIGNTDLLGKPQGSDSAADKSTYVQLMGVEGAQQYLDSLHKKALLSLADIPYNTAKLEQFSDVLLKRDH